MYFKNRVCSGLCKAVRLYIEHCMGSFYHIFPYLSTGNFRYFLFCTKLWKVFCIDCCRIRKKLYTVLGRNIAAHENLFPYFLEKPLRNPVWPQIWTIVTRLSPYLDKNNKTSPKFPFFPEFFKFFLLTPIGKYSIMDIGLIKMMTKRWQCKPCL